MCMAHILVYFMCMCVRMARDILAWIYVETRGWLQVSSLILSTILLNCPLQGWPCTGKPGWRICIPSSTASLPKAEQALRRQARHAMLHCSTVGLYKAFQAQRSQASEAASPSSSEGLQMSGQAQGRQAGEAASPSFRANLPRTEPSSMTGLGISGQALGNEVRKLGFLFQG